MKKLLFILLLLPLFTDAQIITTIAGTGSSTVSGDGGPATAAGVPDNNGGAFDRYGNYYFSEISGKRVRKINTAGIITTFAGTGLGGPVGDGGLATAASLTGPEGVKFDADGNLYITDGGGARIRKVDAITGIISTIAGTGVGGYSGDGGPATAAQIWDPWDVCFDKWGNLYIADYMNYRIRKVDTFGIITTFAGIGTLGFGGDGGPATAALLFDIEGLTSDDTGNVYIADRSNARIRKVNTLGIITTFAGNGSTSYIGDGVPATNAQMAPTKLVFDASGNLFIADSYNYRAYKIDPAGIFHLIAGNGTAGNLGDGGPATAAQLNHPVGIAIDLCGSLYLPETNGNRIRKITYPPVLTNPSISLSGITTSTVGASVTITATVANAGSSYLIHWMNHGMQFSTTTVPSVTYTKPAGFDTITARVVPIGYGCYDSTTSAGHIVYVESAVNYITVKETFVVYPNPTNGVLNITGSKITSVTISNLPGQTVYTHEYNAQQVQIDVADLPKGIYFVKVNGTEVRKFVKETF